MKRLLILLLLVPLIAGCIGDNSLTELTIGNNTYTFSHDIQESMKVPVNNRDAVHDLLHNASHIDVLFEGGTKDDNYFSVISFNTVVKLNTYFNQINNSKTFRAIDIKNATFEHVSIVLVGPHTGANETSIRVDGKMIIVQGKTFEELQKASDKLVLIALNFEYIAEGI